MRGPGHEASAPATQTLTFDAPTGAALNDQGVRDCRSLLAEAIGLHAPTDSSGEKRVGFGRWAA